jgi:hypothetical protein
MLNGVEVLLAPVSEEEPDEEGSDFAVWMTRPKTRVWASIRGLRIQVASKVLAEKFKADVGVIKAEQLDWFNPMPEQISWINTKLSCTTKGVMWDVGFRSKKTFEMNRRAVIRAFELTLKKGAWSPKILPTKFPCPKGFMEHFKSYSRLGLGCYDPYQDTLTLATDARSSVDGRYLCWWNPRDLNRGKAEDYGEDAEIFRLAQVMKQRIIRRCHCDRVLINAVDPKILPTKRDEAGRLVLEGKLPDRAIGRPIFEASQKPTYSIEWMNLFKGEDNELERLVDAGDHIPRGALEHNYSSESITESYAGFKWLPRLKNEVLAIKDPDWVYPRLKLHSSDFPEDLKTQDPDFFSGGEF